MYQPTRDLAAEVCFRPNFWQTKARINYLIDEYLSCEELCDRLEDLPQQFKNPQPRQWATINWQDLNSEQVIGIDLEIFLAIIRGAIDTEAPIRGYTQTSNTAKFCGVGMWLYPNSAKELIRELLSQIHTILPVSYVSNPKSKSNINSTFQRMMSVLNWQSWSVLSRGELIYTFVWILKRIWLWNARLTPEYLHSCCASPDLFGNNNVEYNQPKISIF